MPNAKAGTLDQAINKETCRQQANTKTTNAPTNQHSNIKETTTRATFKATPIGTLWTHLEPRRTTSSVGNQTHRKDIRT